MHLYQGDLVDRPNLLVDFRPTKRLPLLREATPRVGLRPMGIPLAAHILSQPVVSAQPLKAARIIERGDRIADHPHPTSSRLTL